MVMKTMKAATSSSATIKSRGLVKGKNKKDPLPEEDVKKRPAAKKQRFGEDDAKFQFFCPCILLALQKGILFLLVLEALQ